MKGAYEFLVTIQPDAEDSSKMAIDARCVLMNTKRNGYMTSSSWTCDLANGPKVIEDLLVGAYRWFVTCVEEEECKFNNAIACQDVGK